MRTLEVLGMGLSVIVAGIALMGCDEVTGSSTTETISHKHAAQGYSNASVQGWAVTHSHPNPGRPHGRQHWMHGHDFNEDGSADHWHSHTYQEDLEHCHFSCEPDADPDRVVMVNR